MNYIWINKTDVQIYKEKENSYRRYFKKWRLYHNFFITNYTNELQYWREKPFLVHFSLFPTNFIFIFFLNLLKNQNEHSAFYFAVGERAFGEGEGPQWGADAGGVGLSMWAHNGAQLTHPFLLFCHHPFQQSKPLYGRCHLKCKDYKRPSSVGCRAAQSDSS